MGLAIRQEDIIEKISLLDNREKTEVIDFIDFLISKNRKSKKEIKRVEEILLNTSIWSEEDIDNIIEAGKEISNWKIESF